VAGVAVLEDDGRRRQFALEGGDLHALGPAVARAVTGAGWDLFGLEPERRDLEALFGAVSEGAGVVPAAGFRQGGGSAVQEAAHV
jgi:gliding motility-associated transport system ATP-binding protein